jgi:hypothetical protein
MHIPDYLGAGLDKRGGRYLGSIPLYDRIIIAALIPCSAT